MIDFVQNTLDGVLAGSSYALLAVGFTLIFGVMRRINLAFGSAIMVGIFAGTLVYLQLQSGMLMVALATLAGATLAGIYVERLCFWAVRSGAAVASMVSSFAIWMQLEEIVTALFPDRTYAFPSFGDDVLELGPFILRFTHAVMFAIAALLTILLHRLLYHSRFGLTVRAVSENSEAARLLGLNTDRVVFLTFALASLIGGAAGFMVAASNEQITPLFGLWATFKGLVAMMLGGMGSFPGAIAGGLLLGVIEAHSAWYLGTEYRDLVAYAVLFCFLAVRPGGLLGNRSYAREASALRRV